MNEPQPGTLVYVAEPMRCGCPGWHYGKVFIILLMTLRLTETPD